MSLDPSELVGTWVNTEPAPTAIARVVIETRQGSLHVHAFGAGEADWGLAEADGLYAASADQRVAVAFTASYRHVELQANVSKGLLIVASFSAPADGRPGDTFAREFFRRA
jgi:hypothetical protein